MTPTNKPGRPFGLSVAIILSVVYFSILPLLEAILIFSVNRHFENLSVGDEAAASGFEQPLAMGISGLPIIDLWQVLLGLLFLVVAFFAWRGRPSSIRYVMMFSIIGITIFNLVQTLLPPAPEAGVDSSQQFYSSFSGVIFIGNLLVIAYVLWYMNRGPSRAFYRGYYLSEPQAAE